MNLLDICWWSDWLEDEGLLNIFCGGGGCWLIRFSLDPTGVIFPLEVEEVDNKFFVRFDTWGFWKLFVDMSGCCFSCDDDGGDASGGCGK